MMTRQALVGFILINVFVSLVVAVLIIVVYTATDDSDPMIITRIVQATQDSQAFNNTSDTYGQVPLGALEGTVGVLTLTIDAWQERSETQEAILATAGLLQPTNTPRPSNSAAGGGSGVPTLRIDDIRPVITLPFTSIPGGSTSGSAAVPTADDGCQRYTVIAGDTCAGIAAQFEVDLDAFININGINSTCSNLRQDQEVIIPSDSCQPPPTPTLQPSLTRTPFPIGTFAITNTPAATATNPEVEIRQILGYGDVNNERVELRNTGNGVIALGGWTLEDDDGNVFVFPDVRLQPQAIINVVSRIGQNTALALYWNQQVAVWQEGDTINLYDATGTLQTSGQVGSEIINFGQ